MLDDRHQLIANTSVRVLREGLGSRAEVRVLQQPDRLVVLKDFTDGNTACRLLGLFLISREREAYEHLSDLPGVPAWCGQLNSWSMMIEYREAERVSEVPAERLTPEFYTRLLALIEGLHDRGVAHADLKRLDNILITPQGEPILVDFAAAFCHGSNPLCAILFPYLFDDDLRAVYKLKARRTPHLLTAEEQDFLARRSAVERFFRWAREYFRRPVQRLAGSDMEAVTDRNPSSDL
jgi:hypothetical protein